MIGFSLYVNLLLILTYCVNNNNNKFVIANKGVHNKQRNYINLYDIHVQIIKLITFREIFKQTRKKKKQHL